MNVRLVWLAAALVACSPDSESTTPTPATPGDGPYPAILPEHAGYDHDDGRGREGELMNAFVLPDQHGNAVDFRQFLGFVTVIDVGAVWCQPCQEAASTFQALSEELAEVGPAWTVSVLVQDANAGPPSVNDANEWAEAFAIDAPVLADELQDNLGAWDLREWPTTFFVAPDGTIVRRADGRVDDAEISAEVARLLQQYAGQLREE